MMSKPMKTLELHNPMIKVLIIRDEQWVAWVVQQCAVVNIVKNKIMIMSCCYAVNDYQICTKSTLRSSILGLLHRQLSRDRNLALLI